MNHRHLGQSGVVVSEISYGNWITHASQVEKENPNVSSAIVGASRPEQVRDNVKASGVTLDDAIMKRIDEVVRAVVERDPRKTVSQAKRP